MCAARTGIRARKTKRAEQNNEEEGPLEALYFIFVDLVSGRTGSVGGVRARTSARRRRRWRRRMRRRKRKNCNSRRVAGLITNSQP